MPDITLCSNETCPINYKCYRFLAEPNKHWQSYSYFIPEDGVCKDFLPVKYHQLNEYQTERYMICKRGNGY